MSNNQRLSELYNNFLAPEAVIWIENKKLSEKEFFFTNLEIDKTLDGADTCTFSIPDAINLEFNAKEKLFELGDNVEVHIGYADSHKNKADLSILFKGIITNVNWSFSENNYLSISIEAKDYSFLMMKHKYENSMTDIKDSDVLNRIISEIYSNLFPQGNRKIETTMIEYKKVQNDKENDYLFIKSLAERNGYEFFINNDYLYFRPIPKILTSEITLRYGEEILGFKPELNIEKEISQVQVVGLELSSDKKPIIGIAKREDGAFDDTKEGIKRLLKKLNSVEYKVKEPVKSEEEAKKRAEYLLENFINNSFKAELRTIGIPDLIPGMAITLDSLGKKFSNIYYIEKAVHSFSEQGYETTVNLASKKG